jgi:hypothetical protein
MLGILLLGLCLATAPPTINHSNVALECTDQVPIADLPAIAPGDVTIACATAEPVLADELYIFVVQAPVTCMAVERPRCCSLSVSRSVNHSLRHAAHIQRDPVRAGV